MSYVHCIAVVVHECQVLLPLALVLQAKLTPFMWKSGFVNASPQAIEEVGPQAKVLVS